MTLARRVIRQSVVTALGTIAGLTVESPGDWDAQPIAFPLARVRVEHERKASVGRHMPEFTTTVTVVVQTMLQATTAEAAQDAIEDLGDLVEIAVLGCVALVGESQQFSSVNTQQSVNADGLYHVGTATVAFDVEVFEAFDPTVLGTAELSPEDIEIVPVIDLQSSTPAPPAMLREDSGYILREDTSKILKG